MDSSSGGSSKQTMEQITLGQIAVAVAFFVALITGVSYLLKQIKAAIKSALKDEFKPINDKIDELGKHLDSVDMESCKNFLVSVLSDIEKGLDVDEIERERFWEQYQHYQKIGGNSYIKKKVDQLEKEGKI